MRALASFKANDEVIVGIDNGFQLLFAAFSERHRSWASFFCSQNVPVASSVEATGNRWVKSLSIS